MNVIIGQSYDSPIVSNVGSCIVPDIDFYGDSSEDSTVYSKYTSFVGPSFGLITDVNVNPKVNLNIDSTIGLHLDSFSRLTFYLMYGTIYLLVPPSSYHLFIIILGLEGITQYNYNNEKYF